MPKNTAHRKEELRHSWVMMAKAFGKLVLDKLLRTVPKHSSAN